MTSHATILRRACKNVPEPAIRLQQAYAESREQHRVAYDLPRPTFRSSKNVDDGEATEVEPLYVAPVMDLGEKT